MASCGIFSVKRYTLFLQSLYEFGCDELDPASGSSHQSIGSLNVTVNSPRHAAALLG